MPDILAPLAVQHFNDNNGNPLVGGQLFTYAAGTTTPLATYTDSTGVTPNTNPVILNSRGECSVWLPPNVAYKFQLQDSFGNTIWTVDQIVNAQLITLYGGVDTGIVNAYLLTFAANFTSYTDGIIVYWIPANTNTGASTININGLGVISVVNPDGSTLLAGEIVANQVATILIKGGKAILTSATNIIYGTFNCTWGGFSVAPSNTTVSYRKNGTLVTLYFQTPGLTGTSNSTTFFLTGLPAVITPIFNGGFYSIVGLEDNGTLLAGGAASPQAAGSVLFFKDGTSPSWTASGTKGLANNVAFTYSI